MNGETFLACVRRVFVRALRPSDVVNMDNLGCHKSTAKLPPLNNRLDDLRRQQCRPEHAAETGPVDFLCRYKFGDAGALAILQRVLPTVCPGERATGAGPRTLLFQAR